MALVTPSPHLYNVGTLVRDGARDDAAPDDPRLEIATQRFDFGQFGHGS